MLSINRGGYENRLRKSINRGGYVMTWPAGGQICWSAASAVRAAAARPLPHDAVGGAAGSSGHAWTAAVGASGRCHRCSGAWPDLGDGPEAAARPEAAGRHGPRVAAGQSGSGATRPRARGGRAAEGRRRPAPSSDGLDGPVMGSAGLSWVFFFYLIN